MLRLIYRFYRWHTSLRYWTERRFTPAGLVVIGATAVVVMVSPDVENNVAYQAAALLFVLLGMGIVWSWFFRGRFAIERGLPRFGTVGLPLHYRVRIRNVGKRPQRGLVLLEDLADSRPAYRDFAAAHKAAARDLRSFRVGRPKRLFPLRQFPRAMPLVPPLPPGQGADVEMELLPRQRGLLRFDGVTLARTDPFGLFRSFVRVPAPQYALILPRRYALPPVALPGSMQYQQGGVAMASHVGQSEEFVGLRDYRRGDPLRHIHWRTWARAGKPVVREFEDEFFMRHALVLDTFTANPLSAAFEEAVSVAASFACTILTQESLLDLLFVGAQSYCFTAGRGLAHADQMLEILAAVQPCHDHTFEVLRHSVQNHIRLVSGVVCVFLSWDDERREFVRELKAAGLPLRVFLLVEPGSSRDLDPGPLRDCPEDFRVLEAGQVARDLAGMT